MAPRSPGDPASRTLDGPVTKSPVPEAALELQMALFCYTMALPMPVCCRLAPASSMAMRRQAGRALCCQHSMGHSAGGCCQHTNLLPPLLLPLHGKPGGESTAYAAQSACSCWLRPGRATSSCRPASHPTPPHSSFAGHAQRGALPPPAAAARGGCLLQRRAPRRQLLGRLPGCLRLCGPAALGGAGGRRQVGAAMLA